MTFLGRILALLWLPVSIVLTAGALAHLFNLIHPDAVQWAQVVKAPLAFYDKSLGELFKPVGAFIQQKAAFTPPLWSADAAIAYTSSASACMLAGTTLTKREGFLDGARSSAASLGWPIAILLFAFTSVRNRVVTRFAAEHTILFVLYVLGVAGVLGAALYADHWGVGTTVNDKTAALWQLLGTGAA